MSNSGGTRRVPVSPGARVWERAGGASPKLPPTAAFQMQSKAASWTPGATPRCKAAVRTTRNLQLYSEMTTQREASRPLCNNPGCLPLPGETEAACTLCEPRISPGSSACGRGSLLPVSETFLAKSRWNRRPASSLNPSVLRPLYYKNIPSLEPNKGTPWGAPSLLILLYLLQNFFK